jgi:hypothetical protein
VFLVAALVVEPEQVSLGIPAVDGWLTSLVALPLAGRVGAAAASIVLGLLSLSLFFRGIGITRRPRSIHILTADDKGLVVVDSHGIAVVAEAAATSAHGVMAAEVEVIPRGAQQVKLRLDVDVYPGANVKRAGTEARDACKDAVEKLVGVEVVGITATTHVLEPEEMARVMA